MPSFSFPQSPEALALDRREQYDSQRSCAWPMAASETYRINSKADVPMTAIDSFSTNLNIDKAS